MNAKVIVEYVTKTDQLQKGVGQLAASGSKAKVALSRAFIPAAAALGVMAVAAGKSVEAASALNEQMSASTQVFGDHAKEVQDWSKTTADSAGLSRTEALKAANAYGNMFATVGLGSKDVSTMSRSMVQLAGDMASFHDQDPTEMLQKLQSGLAGEAEPLRKFGVLLSDARVKQFAYANGIAKTGSNLTEAQKVQARYGVILQDSAKAQGDFARTGDSVANRQRKVAAETENVSAQFGTALLPVTQAVLGVMTSLLGFLGRYPGLLKVLVIAIAGLAAAIVVLNVALTVMALVTAPVGVTILLVVAAVVALIAVGVLLWRNWDKITAALKAAWLGIENAALSAKAQIVGAFTSLASAVTSIVRGFLAWLSANWRTIIVILAGPIGLAVVLIARYWSQITAGARSAVAAIQSAWNGLKTWLAGVAGTIGGYLSRISSAFGAIGDAAHAAASSIRSAISGVIEWLDRQVAKFRSAGSSIANALKGPINSFIASWNSSVIRVPKISIPTLDTKLPGVGKIGGGTAGGQSFGFPHIPPLARGAVIDSPTLALIGEGRGRELVTPEALLRSIVGESGGGDQFTLNVYPRTADAEDVAWGFRRLELLRTGR